MLEESINIALKTNDKNKILELNNFHLSPTYGETDLYVYSNGFSIDQHFYFENLEEFISKLKVINDKLLGEAILKQNYEQDYIKFIADKRGHIIVEGEIFWNSDYSQNIHFSFQTDQTVLNPFIADLEKVKK